MTRLNSNSRSIHTGAKQTSDAFGSTPSVFAIQASAGAQVARLAMVIRLGYHLEPEMKEMALV